MAQVIIDPVSRVSGHLSVELDVKNGAVFSAKVKGDMFRGFELILKERNPVDAVMISQRICGICPVPHAIASSRCLESAFGIVPAQNGIILRNIILAVNFIQSHITSFYHLSLMDYFDVKALAKYSGSDEQMISMRDWTRKTPSAPGSRNMALAPFLPGYEGNFYIKNDELNLKLISGYFKALDIRMKCQKLASVFAGKMPHAASIVPGGVTQKITPDNTRDFKKIFPDIVKFVNEVYYQDAIALSEYFPEYTETGGFDKFLSFGGFTDEISGEFLFNSGILKNGIYESVDIKKITEDVKYSRYSSKSGLAPGAGETVPYPDKKDAYSWAKAPRYNRMPFETGPLARILIGAERGNSEIINMTGLLEKKSGLNLKKLNSLMGRHICRAIESVILAGRIPQWLDQLQADSKTRTQYEIPEKAEGTGLAEAPRGALGHWISIKDYKIENYQCVVPTAWNLSPRDEKDIPGVIEQVLAGITVDDLKNPIVPERLIRSFDPCIACAVHAIEKR